MSEAETRAFELELLESPKSWERLLELADSHRRRPAWRTRIAASVAAGLAALLLYTQIDPASVPVERKSMVDVEATRSSKQQDSREEEERRGADGPWSTTGPSSHRVELTIALDGPAGTTVEFGAYHLHSSGLFALRSDVNVSEDPFAYEATFTGSLSEFAGTTNPGTYRVLLAARKKGKLRDVWLLPNAHKAVEVGVQITSPDREAAPQ